MAFSQTALSEREFYFATLPVWEPPPSAVFQHKPPSGKPAEPVFPGALTTAEQEEVRRWQRDATPATDADAIAKVNEYIVYEKALRAWKFADHLARLVQHRWALADAAVLNKTTLSVASDDAGAGSSPPPPKVVKQGYQEP